MALSERTERGLIIGFMILMILVILFTILDCIYFMIADNYVNGNSNQYNDNSTSDCGCNKHVKFSL